MRHDPSRTPEAKARAVSRKNARRDKRAMQGAAMRRSPENIKGNVKGSR
jgi:hypothetical protein